MCPGWHPVQPGTPSSTSLPMQPSPYWGKDPLWDGASSLHNAMMDEQGRVYLNKNEIPIEELKTHLTPLIARSEHKVVRFSADKQMRYEIFVKAIDAARANDDPTLGAYIFEAARFDRLGVFSYSDEDTSASFHLDGKATFGSPPLDQFARLAIGRVGCPGLGNQIFDLMRH